MTHIPQHPNRPAGTVLVPTAAIGGLSVALAMGMELLGVHQRMTPVIARLVSRQGAETFPNHLPAVVVALATMGFAFGIAFAILSTSGILRRAILWLTPSVLLAASAPVLSLAAYSPDISSPWIATFWAGVCALVYSANHRMPCESPTSHEAR